MATASPPNAIAELRIVLERTAASRRNSGVLPFNDPVIDGRLPHGGLTETAAGASGKSISVSTRPMTRVGRAVEKSETQGFMNVVADTETKQILGAAILGTGGDEAIHGILDMMNADQSTTALRWAMPIHPTVSELIPTVLQGLTPVSEEP